MTPAEAVRRASAQAAREVLEARLALALRANRIEHTREFSLPGRQFRWDFAFPEAKLLVEVQGGIWKKGAHSSGAGITRDAEKSAYAAGLGWRSFPVTSKHITSGEAVAWIKSALEAV